jgi:peptide methionine sulfoxide reductase msrA/msrB
MITDRTTSTPVLLITNITTNTRVKRQHPMQKIIKTDEEWKKQLTEEQYRIARGKGTEPAFCGVFYDNHQDGIYHCVCCDLPLFESNAKFESGTGWPSFFKPVAKENVETIVDRSHGMVRMEIVCARCDAHLGHVFEDGPKPTGLRYCLNSTSLRFEPAKAAAASAKTEGKAKLEKASFGAGCFWGVEAAFHAVPGVQEAVSGYQGGTLKNPTYEDVCTGRTNHAEVVQVTYDPAKVSYQDLLRVFWEKHDPTTPNRQGPDTGTQYRSVIFTYSPEQQKLAEASKAEAQANFRRPIVTQILPAPEFYPAEEYHQKYLEKRGQRSCRI